MSAPGGEDRCSSPDEDQSGIDPDPDPLAELEAALAQGLQGALADGRLDMEEFGHLDVKEFARRLASRSRAAERGTRGSDESSQRIGKSQSG